MADLVTAQLSGPEFTGTATELRKHATVGTIGELQVYGGNGTPLVQTLPPALGMLKSYFAPKGGHITLYLDDSLVPAAMVSQLQAASGVPVSVAHPLTVLEQMKNDSDQGQQERMKILQNTQTKIFDVQQDVTGNKNRTAEKAFEKFDQYIRQ